MIWLCVLLAVKSVLQLGEIGAVWGVVTGITFALSALNLLTSHYPLGARIAGATIWCLTLTTTLFAPVVAMWIRVWALMAVDAWQQFTRGSFTLTSSFRSFAYTSLLLPQSCWHYCVWRLKSAVGGDSTGPESKPSAEVLERLATAPSRVRTGYRSRRNWVRNSPPKPASPSSTSASSERSGAESGGSSEGFVPQCPPPSVSRSCESSSDTSATHLSRSVTPPTAPASPIATNDSGVATTSLIPTTSSKRASSFGPAETAPTPSIARSRRSYRSLPRRTARPSGNATGTPFAES
jgi:hypothetical protein